MRERPILFSTPMVQAIIAGRKTVTRRVLKPQPDLDGGPPLATGWFHPETADGGPGPHTFGVYGVDWHVRCPYGAPNDQLWCREAWTARDARGDWAPSVRDVDQERDEILYRADIEGTHAPSPLRWLSPLYMPRWASRITLEVVSVRVERLQEITEEDARAEGLDWVSPQPFGERWDDDDREDPREVGYAVVGESSGFARDNFRRLWDQINGKPGKRWEDDPWVWRVEFRRVT
jgi:hypothetical protein